MGRGGWCGRCCLAALACIAFFVAPAEASSSLRAGADGHAPQTGGAGAKGKALALGVSAVSPAVSPLEGGVSVSVTGSGFVPSAGKNAVCRFYGQIYALAAQYSTATVLSPTALKCATPPFPVEGATYLEVSMNGTTGPFSASEVQFNFVQYFSAVVEKMPYQNETSGAVLYQVAKQVTGDGLRVAVSYGKTVLTDGAATADGSKAALEFPMSVLPANGTIDLSVELTWDGGSIMRTVPLLRVNFKPLTVVVDRRTRGLQVGGKPFFPTGFMGHNHVVIYSFAALPGYEQQEVLTEALNAGVRVQIGLANVVKPIITGSAPIHSSEYDGIWTQINATIALCMDHPGTLGWYLTDDTIIFNSSRVAEVYDVVKALDPWHPVFNTFSGSGQAWSYYTPRIGFDVGQYEAYFLDNPSYQVLTIPLTWPLNWVPAIICGQADAYNHATQKAFNLQLFISMMYGATGMIWFLLWEWTESYWLDFYATSFMTGNLLRYVQPALLGGNFNRPEVQSSNPDVGAVAWWENDTPSQLCARILVANLQKPPAAFTLTSSMFANSTIVHALFEDRFVNVTSSSTTGSFTEYLGSYGTIIYSVGCADDVISSVSGSGVDAANLVSNPTFEANYLSNVADGSYWRPELFGDRFDEVALSPAAFIDPSTSINGRNSYRFVAPGQSVRSGGAGVEVPLTAKLTPGIVYTFSFWIRFPMYLPGQETFTVFVLPAPLDSPVLSVEAGSVAPFQWVQKSCTFTATDAGPPTIKVTEPGHFWMDDVVVEVAPS